MTHLEQVWNTPPINLRLLKMEVHVWRASLEQPASVIQNLQKFLAPDEVTRAWQFYFEKDRNHFIVARGLLRVILGRYLNTDPSHLRFCYNSYGKPSLDFIFHQVELSFNLSHSHNLGLYAFAYSRQIGIDVEYMHSNVDYEQLAKHSFSPYENAVFHALPLAIKRQAFFNCWTRKEAYIKARGKGLSLSLDQFDVSLKPNEPARLLNSREDPQEIVRWSLQALAPGTDYVGALAVEGSEWHLSCWQW